MDIRIIPNKLCGTVSAIPSKSQAHRMLICAAFADAPTNIECPQINKDIEATADCLRALGAEIQRIESGFQIKPVSVLPECAVLKCGESGSTLRFLLPVVCALGVKATFELEGRLPYRPLSPLWEELEKNGCQLSRPTETSIQVGGKLTSGTFLIDGNVSSQFISGLLFAAALLNGTSKIIVKGKLESKPYVEMTQHALATFGVPSNDYTVTGHFPLHSPCNISIEGDWSNGAFFLAANALGSSVNVTNLNADSLQGDAAVVEILKNFAYLQPISVADIPDLVPILAVVFGAKNGAVFTDVARLRLKESDRVASVCKLLDSLGAKTVGTESTLTVFPGTYHSCSIDSFGDHRIAMAAAIAATVAEGPVTIHGAECVSKSYPAFWQDYRKLGGKYE